MILPCRRLSALLLPLLLTAVACSPGGGDEAGLAAGSTPGAYELIGGLWWNGEAFEARTAHVADGRFVAAAVPGAEEVDLDGAYVLPPFADAHTHALDSADSFERRNANLLEQGIFYVKNPNNPTRLSAEVRDLAAAPGTVDVVLSNAGLTRSGGHPEPLYRMLGERGVYGPPHYADTAAVVEDARWAADSVAELEQKWPRIVATRPDFVKLYLLESNGRPAPSYGLMPAPFRRAVELAHRDGLTVSVHVNTAADFRLAVEAGADEINHTPGRRVPQDVDPGLYLVSPEVARQAASQGTVVVTTAVVAFQSSDEATMERSLPVFRQNVDTLRQAGVRLAIGSDDYFSTARDEAELLAELGVLSRAEILHAWSEVTPRAIFPDRAVGGTAPGDEASFVALRCDPLAYFACVRRIGASMKEGAWVEPR